MNQLNGVVDSFLKQCYIVFVLFLFFITLTLRYYRSCQVNHFLIGLQIIRFYALQVRCYYSKRNDVSSQSTLSVLIVNRNNEQMLLMYFRFACSRDIFRCNQLLYGTDPFQKYSRSLSKELDLLLILNRRESLKTCISTGDTAFNLRDEIKLRLSGQIVLLEKAHSKIVYKEFRNRIVTPPTATLKFVMLILLMTL